MRVPLLITLVAVAVATSCASTQQPLAPALTPAGVRFTIERADAMAVAVAGSFNQWSTSSHPLRRIGSSRTWSTVVRLPPGEHLFMFVIDGRWVTPPAAEDYADDGFGARNGIVVVRDDER